MIESSKRAKSMLRQALDIVNRERLDINTDEVRDYQAEVR